MAENKSLKYSFSWQIKNFSLCYFKNDEKLCSPVFSPEIFGGSRWCIELYPKGNVSTLGYMSCYLRRKEKDNYRDTITVDYTMEIAAENGEVLDADTCRNISFTAGFSWGWPEWIKITEVEDNMKKCPSDTLNITCHLFCNYKKLGCVGSTKFGGRKHSFLWNVRMPDETPELKLISFSNSLQFEICVTAPSDDIKIVICLKTNKCSLNRILISKMALLDLKENEVDSRRSTHLFVSENDRFEYPVFITKKQLMDKKSSYIEDDCFLLWGEFSVSDGIEYSRILESKIDDTYSTAVLTLQKDFLNMFLNEKHADVKLRVNDEIISAHKSILSARSPVFDAMFNQEMVEAKTGVVDISSVDTKTMRYFLEYMYTGVMKNLDYVTAKDLLILSDRYQVIPLKEKCADFLISCISVRNVCDTFATADLVSHEQLKNSAVEYIITHSSKILVTDEWNEVLKNNPKLASDVYSSMAINYKFTPIRITK